MTYTSEPLYLRKNIGIAITTFLRDESLFRCIKSILYYYPHLKMYILDQGKISKYKKAYYKYLKRLGHHIQRMPYDCGISVARKTAMNIIKKPYVLYIQDDFVFNENTNIDNMLKILEKNKELGVVGGAVIDINKPDYQSCGYFFVKIEENILYIPCAFLLNNNLLKWQYIDSSIQYCYADIVSDFTLWKNNITEVFDEKVKILEHSHVYLKLKHETNWKVAFTPNSSILHSHDRQNNEYKTFRVRQDDVEYLHNYWKTSNFLRLDAAIPKIFRVDSLLASTVKIIKVNDKKTTPQIMLQESANNNVNQLVDLLIAKTISFYIAGDSCLELLNNKKLISEPLQIGLLYDSDAAIVMQLDKNIKILNSNVQKIKQLHYNNKTYPVPCPLVLYMKNLFGENWEKLITKNKSK